MGGIGSGRRNQAGKAATEDSRPLDIRKLNRSGLLQPGQSFGWQWTICGRPVSDIRIQVRVDHVLLAYKFRNHRGAEWEDVSQSIHMDRTPCHLGGTRCWWICPTCERRVAVLYSPGRHYACRHCLQLTYASQRETADDRAARQADRVRRLLGWRVGILNPRGEKPKGMQWRTFAQLTARHDAYVDVSMTGMAERFGLMNRRVKGIGPGPLDE